MFSDGAARASTRVSSASWAVLAFQAHEISLVAAGALLFDEFVGSLVAETMGFELALAALLNLSRGELDLVPHRVEVSHNLTEFLMINGHLLKLPQ